MSDWQTLVENKDWGGLDDFWHHHASQEDCGEILEALRRVVPVVERTNGMERELVHAEPAEVPENIAGAAMILLLGELEAYAAGDAFLPTDMQQWTKLSEEVQEACTKLAALPEVTTGDDHMSRSHHAKEAGELMASILRILEAVLYPGNDDDEEPDGFGGPIQEHVATAATYAFAAGRHYQAALGKEHEPAAIRGAKVLQSAREGAASTNSYHAALRKQRFARMTELVPRWGVSQAARICAREGLGTASAIRVQWYR